MVIIQNDELNDETSLNGGTVIVAPLSSNIIEVESHAAMASISADIPELASFSYKVLLFGIRAIDTNCLKNHIGRLSDEIMAELDKKLKYALSL